MPASRRPAVLRGFAGSTLAIFVALAGHVSAGGAMPGPLGIVVPWVLSLMVCVLLAGRKLSVVRLSASVVLSQILFHTLFVLGTITPSGGGGGHVHGAPLEIPAASSTATALVADGAMWLGHAIAALVTIIALHRSERLVLSLRDLAVQAVRWIRRRFDVIDIRPVAPRATVSMPAEKSHRHPAAPLLSALRGRAPPLVSAF
jgi:hypothetical protein